jgi:hypothetical protein
MQSGICRRYRADRRIRTDSTIATTAEQLGFSTISAQPSTGSAAHPRYRIALLGSGRAATGPETVARVAQMARRFVEPAANL